MRLVKILALVGDRGGFNALNPVLELALQKGYEVQIILTATCAKEHTDGTLPLHKSIEVLIALDADNVERLVLQHSSDILVIASSQSKAGTEASVAAIRASEGRRILVLEDMYGSAHNALKEAAQQKMIDRVKAVCVTDEAAKELLRQRVPSLKDCVFAEGGPQYDYIPKLRKEFRPRRKDLRDSMGVNKKQPVFLVSGGQNGTRDMLEMVEQAIPNSCENRNPKIILKQHPSRATNADKEAVQCYLGSSPCRKRFIEVSALSSEDLLPGVDFILTPYSTTARFGIYLGMSGVIYVGSPVILRDFQEEKGADLDRPLEAKAGAAWYVTKPEELARRIKDVLNNTVSADFHRAQMAFTKTCDGNATLRVFSVLQSLI